ncbi:hypothetical protein Hdeb2414_s0008g00273811 [Helianthus debilis subsp. tardiflorus]
MFDDSYCHVDNHGNQKLANTWVEGDLVPEVAMMLVAVEEIFQQVFWFVIFVLIGVPIGDSALRAPPASREVVDHDGSRCQMCHLHEPKFLIHLKLLPCIQKLICRFPFSRA